MQTANPILSRIDRDAAQASAAPTGPGFAYDEGRTAVVSAQAPAPAATATHEAGIYAGVSLPAPPGQRVTFADPGRPHALAHPTPRRIRRGTRGRLCTGRCQPGHRN
ncbi:MAG: hypothetical protein ACKOFP_03700, partial [Actinomycetota bacterium]